MSGCAWQRIPDAPQYQPTASLPLRVGIELSNSPASMTYGPQIIQELKAWSIFERIVYPYRKDDAVDAVLKMTLSGTWTADPANFAKGFIIGLSLFTLSPVIGSSMTGIHDINASLLQKDAEIAKYDVHTETSLEWGLAADTNEVARKAESLQVKKLADGLTTKLKEDWPRISMYFSPIQASTQSETRPITEQTKAKDPSLLPSNLPIQPTVSDLSERAEKLRQLKKLKDEGLLTEEEFEKKRKLIVEGL